ncbi:hypothetical protein ACH4PU_12555 [Streptomyces sp. NPDC021100]
MLHHDRARLADAPAATLVASCAGLAARAAARAETSLAQPAAGLSR